ncbi:MAG: pentapeptide repeat-containing protein, partial [Actinomycetota bacterium]|nr:pentapeptide repeat-containing protein [Actinomycetota bacterium]
MVSPNNTATPPVYGPDADPDKANRPPPQTPFLLTLDTRTTDQVKDRWPDLHLPKLKKDREGLRWAFRSVHPDLTSSHGFRWPFPGQWAEAAGPFTGTPGAAPQHRNPCPGQPGDGLCLARTTAGAASGGIKVAGTGLICAYLETDLLGGDADKWRVKKAWVAEVIGTLTELIGYADLRYADLGGANLRGADLGGANLGYANLGYANLRYANLRYANLGGANLRYADLRGANLRGADLGGADLGSADLAGA